MAKPSKPTRAPEAIMSEYANVCAELGDLVYKRDVGIPKAIEEVKDRLVKLNHEHAAAVAAEKESKAHG